MKLFHISDLHIGKQLHYYNLRDNQIEILKQIIRKTKEYRPDVIIIAGDIYDKSVPSAEAYAVFDTFLIELSEITPSIPVLMIAGNHDSAERLNYASTFLEKHHIYISVLPPQREDEHLKKLVFEDEHGEVSFYLLPFTKPGYVRQLFEEGVVTSYDSAIKAVIEREEIDYSSRNILVSHQFYISGDKLPETCESEQAYISVGGVDSVDITAIRQFDYVALGHLHGSQQIGDKHIRYSGTPLKYSVSEERHTKSITMVTLGAKGDEIIIDKIPLLARQDVRKEQGSLSEMISRASEDNRNDFISFTLTDEADLYKPKDQLDEHYNFILEVRVENSRTKAQMDNIMGEASVLDPLEAFREFYQDMNNEPMNCEEERLIAEIITTVKEAENK
jgi:exonuclease SbcD